MNKFFVAFEKTISSLLVLLLATIIIISSLQVLLRYVFNQSLTWSVEFVNYEFIWLICLGMGLAIGKRVHILVDILVDYFPKRLKYAVMLLNILLTIAFMGVLVYYGIVVAARMVETGALTPTMRIPSVYIYAAIPVGGLIGVVYCLRDLFIMLRTGKIIEIKTEAQQVLEETL